MKKNRTILLLLIFLGTAFSRNVLAQCEKAGTTADTTRCMSNAYEKADAELNRIYKLAFKGLDEKEAENLKKAQRAWSSIAMRNVMLNMPNGVEAAGSRSPPRMPRPVNSTPDQRTAQDVSVSINVTGHIVPPRTSPWSNEKPA